MALMLSGDQWVYVGSDDVYAEAIYAGIAVPGFGLGVKTEESPPLYSDSPVSLAPAEVFDISYGMFDSGGYGGAMSEMHPKLNPIAGRLVVEIAGRIAATVGLSITGPEMMRWLHGVTSIYRAGVKIRYLSQQVSDRSGLFESIAHQFDDTIAPHFGGNEAHVPEGEPAMTDEFNWTNPWDWAMAGLNGFGYFIK